MGLSGALLAESWRVKTSKFGYMASYWLKMHIPSFPVSYFMKTVVSIRKIAYVYIALHVHV